MRNNLLATSLSRALAGATMLAAAHAAIAQDAPPVTVPSPHEASAGQAGAAQASLPAAVTSAIELDSVVVHGEIVYRDRSDALAPTLSYDLAYFQRFEPLTVGDMLKRVPSVAFVSDVLEYDGARLRGLDPGYTQVLVNGKKVPGAGDDRSFFVDRIPAELVERVEIVRNTSANRSGDAVAGALNIVLRDAYEFDGAYVRAGGMRYDDGEFKGTAGAVAGGEVGGGRLLGGINVQGRYNPKRKRSDRFDGLRGAFVDREDQDDTRDGTDWSANASYSRDVGDGKLSLSGLVVRTDRTETENSIEYNDPSSTSRANLLSINRQVVDIDQRTTALSGGYAFDMAGGRSDIDLSWSRFQGGSIDVEEESGFDDEDTPPSFDEREGTRILADVDDRELTASFSHERDLASGVVVEFGVDHSQKRRDNALRTSEVDTDEEGAPLPAYDDYAVQGSRIEERRVDPYLMFSRRGGAVEWEAGLRYETTRVDIASTVEGVRDERTNDYATLLPSAHLRWNVDDANRLNLSFGRSVRRPAFNQVLPLLLEGEFGDNDFIGNPQLDPEVANGIDLGWEHRLGRRGIVGVNLFYRDVGNLIEVVNTGAPSAAAVEDYEDDVDDFLDDNPGADENTPGYPQFDPDSFVHTARNVGDGAVYGIELDASTPLTAIGLEHTGVFLNYSWLNSRVDDFLGQRRFNDQARNVLNVGFIQDLPTLGAAFGVSYRRQGDAFSRVLAEEIQTRYGADLEMFIEKRFGEDLSLRLTGSNLLDASKDEVFHKFDNGIDQRNRDYDEYEVERETAGPVYQLVARYTF